MAGRLLFACLSTFAVEFAFAAVPHIWNGTEVQAHEFPWVVTLNKKMEKNSTYFTEGQCGGVLLALNKDDIKSDLVLTAAHCVVKCIGPDVPNCILKKPSRDPDHLTIIAGDHYQSKKDIGEKTVRPSLYEWHSEWDPSQLRYNDIAVIKLKEPLLFTKTIKPAYLPKPNEVIKDPKQCTLAGWGQTSDDKGSKVSEVLRSVNISKVSYGKKCDVEYIPRSKEDTVFCAEAERQKGTACPGDSGSPLWCSGQDGRPLVFGLVSGGGKLCRNGAVYVNVSHYIKWIIDAIARLNSADANH